MLQALLWDVDGTLAETERDGHRVAFNRAFEALGLPWHWDDARYGELLAVTGGIERLLHDLAVRDDAPRDEAARRELAVRIHRLKNQHYAAIVAAGELPLRAGVSALFEDCAAAGVRMAITTTTSAANIDALLGRHLGDDWRKRFAAVVAAEDAPRKKPDPLVFQVALQRLALAPGHALAIEDSPAGVVAARAAGVPVIVTRSRYFATAPVAGALAVGPSLDVVRGWTPEPSGTGSTRIDLATLRRWHVGA